jgi:integrase/recombinase XerD
VLPTVERHCSAASVNRKLAALTSFCEFHARHGVDLAGLLVRMQPVGRGGSATSYKPFLHHITKNKPERRSAIKLKTSSPRPRVLMVKQVQAILDACDHLRDRLLFALVLDVGGSVRPSACATRTWGSPSARSPSSHGTTTTAPAPRPAVPA